MTTREWYEVLAVDSEATPQQITDAYRRLALKYHPDRNRSPDAEDHFKQIVKAYEESRNRPGAPHEAPVKYVLEPLDDSDGSSTVILTHEERKPSPFTLTISRGDQTEARRLICIPLDTQHLPPRFSAGAILLIHEGEGHSVFKIVG
jgi:hypothetical protein